MRQTPVTRRELLLAGGAVLVGSRAALRGTSTLASTLPPDRPEDFDAAVPMSWFDLALELSRTTPGFTPPVVSRALGYAGLTLYESVVPGSRSHRSLQPVLEGLRRLPRGDAGLDWPSVANAAMADAMRTFMAPQGGLERDSIDRLEASLARRLGRRLPASTRRRSVERGQRVAREIALWARSDGGHDGQSRNFPVDYLPPDGPGLWEPTPPSFQRALQPYWGESRCLALRSGADCPPGDPTPYSEDPTSAFFAEAVEVYRAVEDRTPEQEEIARFWSDDPGVTATPPGHSISIATQVLRREDASLMAAAECYAKVGLAVSDAFVACWHAKYRYNLVRPVTFIRRHIDAGWLPMLATPPFPEYPSGHSVQSAAAFGVLADLFGDGYPFDDHTHLDRGFDPRHFASFSDATAEAAISRLYGGIHFRPAIELGVAQGRCIADAVTALPFRRRRTTHPHTQGVQR